MNIENRADGFWIVNMPEGIDEAGPYGTKKDAEEGLRGIKRFIKLTEADEKQARHNDGQNGPGGNIDGDSTNPGHKRTRRRRRKDS